MITRLRLWVIVFLLGGVLPSLIAQTFTEQKNTYPLSADGSKYVVNGFIPFSPMIDESIYANALLWTIKNVCSAQRDGITEVSIPAKSFSCNLVLTSQADAKQKNTYYCTAQFQVKDGKLVYYLSNIQIESSVVIMKKVTPMEKLQPEKKPSHQETMDDFVPVLKNADVVLVNRIVYNASSPKRGDVIVFKPKGNENSHYYTKRIVGLPGETVQIVENQVYINGKKLEEDYKTTKIDTAGIAGEKLKLGGDEYFVLGDNRKNSEDSRSADIGKVKRSYIYGKAWFVASPKKDWGFVK